MSHRRPTDEAVDAALTATRGDKKTAAEFLLIPYAELHTILRAPGPLRDKWVKPHKRQEAPNKKPEPINEAALEIHRPVHNLEVVEPDVMDDAAIAKALEEEDRALQAGLQNIGLKPEAAKLAMELQRFQKRHYTAAVDMLGGGVLKMFFDTMAEVNKINEQLANGPDAVTQMMLRTDRVQLMELMNKIYDRAKRASLLQAQIEAAAGKNKEPQKAKGHLHITAKKGSTVNAIGVVSKG